MKKFLKTLAAIIIATLVNFAGSKIAGHIYFPLYMDSITTIGVAALYGTIPAIIVAILSNGMLSAFKAIALPFMLCHIMTGLFAGLIFARYKKLRGKLSSQIFMWVALVSALSNSALGDTFSLLLYYGNTTNSQIDTVVQGIFIATQNMPFAIYWGGTLDNLIDKIISALFSYGVYSLFTKKQRKEIRTTPSSIIAKIFQIEYIFLFIAIVNLVATGIFKKQANVYFAQQSVVDRALENRVYFGFDCMIYSSLILVFIIVLLELIKYFSEKELNTRLKMQTEIQEKISRDIHDGILQNLAAIEFQIRNEQKEQALFFTKEAINDVRFLCGSLKLDLSKSFVDLLHEQIEIFEQNYFIKTELYGKSEFINEFSDEEKLEIFRVIIEIFNNIAHHAKASEVSVKMVDFSDIVSITITDNGKGFDYKAAINMPNHHGLKNIKERLEKLNGKVAWVTPHQGGSKVFIKLPSVSERKV